MPKRRMSPLTDAVATPSNRPNPKDTHLAIGEDRGVVPVHVRRQQRGDALLVDGRLPLPRCEDRVEGEAVVRAAAHHHLGDRGVVSGWMG